MSLQKQQPAPHQMQVLCFYLKQSISRRSPRPGHARYCRIWGCRLGLRMDISFTMARAVRSSCLPFSTCHGTAVFLRTQVALSVVSLTSALLFPDATLLWHVLEGPYLMLVVAGALCNMASQHLQGNGPAQAVTRHQI